MVSLVSHAAVFFAGRLLAILVVAVRTRFRHCAGGIHDLAFAVPDIATTQAEFAAQSIRMIEPKAAKGAGNFLCNFLAPTATHGIITEYVQLPD